MRRLQMKRQEFKGEITVFLSLIFMLIIFLVGSLLASVSIQTTRSMKRADTQLAIESVFAEYHKELWENYGLFAKEGTNEKEISRRLMFYGAKKMEHKIKRIQLLSDGDGEVFYRQAVKAMGGDILDIWEVSDEAVEEEEKANALEIQSVLEEEEKELPEEDNPIVSVSQLKKSSLLSLVLPDSREISGQTVQLEQLPSHRSLQQGTDNVEEIQNANPINKTIFVTYLIKYFPSFAENVEDQFLHYEAEYLLAGKGSDQENLETVAKKLLSIRMAANYAYLLTDQEKLFEAETVATALATTMKCPAIAGLLKQAILFAWAYGESIMDLRILYNDGCVPLVKTDAHWQLQLEKLVKLGTSEEIQGKDEGEEGLSYENYLEALLLLEDRKTLSMRALDLIELHLEVPVDTCVTAMEIETTLNLEMGVQDKFSTEFFYN